MKIFGGKGHGPNHANNKLGTKQPENGSPPEKKRRTLKGVLIALGVIAILVLAVIIYWNVSTKPPVTTEPKESPVPGQTDPGTVPEETEDPYTENHYYTVLVVGEAQDGKNTDTIMLARFDTVENKVNVASIPRDTLINVPEGGVGEKKINAAYYQSEDGIGNLMDQVERIAGFRPDNYIVVDMDVFIQVVDALGGVEFDVPVDMDYDDWSDNDDDGVFEYEFHVHVKKGLQTLSGYDALGVFRFRDTYSGGDIQRMEVQHDLLMAIAEKCLSTKSVGTLVKIASSVLGNCETDLELSAIQWYIEKFFSMGIADISFFTAPTENCLVRDISYVTLAASDWMDMVNQYLNPYETEIKAEDCAIMNHDGGVIDNRGYRIVEVESFFCTNGEEVYTNFPEAPRA